MNTAQTIFTLVFAISWGTVANVLPRWKPFHFGVVLYKGFGRARKRILLAFVLLNLFPWLLFAVVLAQLSGGDFKPTSSWDMLLMVFRTVPPGLTMFGFYRIWVGVVQCFPNCFYAEDQLQVPEPFRPQGNEEQHEPTRDKIRLIREAAIGNLSFGILYLAFFFTCLISQPK